MLAQLNAVCIRTSIHLNGNLRQVYTPGFFAPQTKKDSVLKDTRTGILRSTLNDTGECSLVCVDSPVAFLCVTQSRCGEESRAAFLRRGTHEISFR